MVGQPSHQISSFKNPVYAVSFPDPFVLEHDGLYYAYATGIADDGKVFSAAVSEDLVEWRPLGGVMPRLDHDSPHYWAPEVVYDNGRFYLYYSVGNEEWMELRVAVSDKPGGPFEDQGVKMTNEQFAIDAHVLKDEDGTWYMFYATDFLEHEFIGTGVVVDRMLDPLTLEGNPRPAARARYDWQVYDPQRIEKGGVRWHTVEGPSVVKRKGRYFMTFSGGNWQNESYGVGFAISERLNDPEEWTQSCDGTSNLPILRSIPERILGPGHNSITRAPNGRELICVYHEWQDNDRKMAIDRMEIVADRVVIFGPTDSPEPVPYQSQRIDKLGRWDVGCGCWNETESGLAAGADSRAEIEFRPDSPSFLFRTGLRIGQGSGAAGVKLKTVAGDEFEAMITVENGEARIRCSGMESGTCESLLSEFRRNAVYQFRIEADERCVTAYLDDRQLGSYVLPASSSSIVLETDGPEAIFSASRITYGFEEFFTDGSLEERGWERSGEWSVESRNLASDGGNASLRKPCGLSGDFELSVNLRHRGAEPGTEIRVMDVTLRHDGGWRLICGETAYDLSGYSLEQFRQLRLVSRSGSVEPFIDEKGFGQMPSAAEHRIIEVAALSGAWELDMVRCTFI